MDCWFCLSTPKVEKHLIVTIGEECYVALPKGGIVNDHVLLVSVGHIGSYISLPDATMKEMDKLREALRQMFAAQGKNMLCFERFILGRNNVQQHMHLQCVPIPNNITIEQCKSLFYAEAKSIGVYQEGEAPNEQQQQQQQHKPVTLIECDNCEKSMSDALLDANLDQSPYFLLELPDQSKLMFPITNVHNTLTFGRGFCAKLLGMKEREDWKKCALSKQEEEALTLAVRKNFASYWTE